MKLLIFWVEVINSKRRTIKEETGHVVQIHVCRKRQT